MTYELPHYRSEEKPGPLVVIEPSKIPGCPFKEALRTYHIVNNGFDPERRGGHYHPEGGKQEIQVCLHGWAEFLLIAPSGKEDRIVLNHPWTAVIIPSMVWHQITLGPQSILLSVASTLFDPKEAITELPF